MKVSSLFPVALIIHAFCNVLQAENLPEEMCLRDNYIIGIEDQQTIVELKTYRICELATNVNVQSVFVANTFLQLFIVNSDRSTKWNAEQRIVSGNAYPEYVTQATHNQSGRFMKGGAFGEGGDLKEVSASFLHFSDCVNEFGYLISGLSAYEFVIRQGFYWPSGKVRPITDFFKEGEKKLLMPEDKLEEVVSVALLKWVEKDKIKDHAIYKIILKTVTKKLVKAYFKVTSKGEVISLNSVPFVPSAEVMPDEDDSVLLEESVLFYVGEKDKLSMGYQFTKTLAFPVYYEYNAEANTYKEYPMRTSEGFNTELETLPDRIPYWNRYIVPTETWLGCPETNFCLGHSFDAILNPNPEYFALFKNNVYYLLYITSAPKLRKGVPLTSYLQFSCTVDAAFSLGERVFFIKDDIVYYKTTIGDPMVNKYKITEVFPGINAASKFPVSAVIALDRGQEADNVNENNPPATILKSSRLGRNQRAAQTTEDGILKKMVYVYFSNEGGGNVYQYQVESPLPQEYPYTPKFKLITKKAFNKVNEALPKSVSLVFTAEDKVVTMVNHFMIEQSAQTFFTQTENLAKFTLVDKYFGCNVKNTENKLTKEFVEKYVAFAAPKRGVAVEPDLGDARIRTKQRELVEPAQSSSEDHCPKIVDTSSKDSETVNDEDTVGSSAMSAKIFSEGFVIQTMVLIGFALIFF